MTIKTVTLLHPGNMGATIGMSAAASGARILWVSDQRTKATMERAKQAGLTEVKTLEDALRESDAVLSVCPPHAAIETADQVAKHRFSGIYVDANAISRTTAEHIGAIVTSAGASFVDGGIIGSPVNRPGTTRLYLGGDRAADVAQLFSSSMLDARVIDAQPGAASALKVAYAAWTKCTDALLLAIRTFARHEGIDAALLEEWAISQPALERRCAQAAAVATPKAWRYVGEMHEIAETFAAAGLPAGFHRAAAEICERLSKFKDQTEPPPTIDSVSDTLLATAVER